MLVVACGFPQTVSISIPFPNWFVIQTTRAVVSNVFCRCESLYPLVLPKLNFRETRKQGETNTPFRTTHSNASAWYHLRWGTWTNEDEDNRGSSFTHTFALAVFIGFRPFTYKEVKQYNTLCYNCSPIACVLFFDGIIKGCDLFPSTDSVNVQGFFAGGTQR